MRRGVVFINDRNKKGGHRGFYNESSEAIRVVYPINQISHFVIAFRLARKCLRLVSTDESHIQIWTLEKDKIYYLLSLLF